jgi:hypothetical protein
MKQKHYQKRAQQRGIREPLIHLIVNYGSLYSRPGGAIAYKLGGKGVDLAVKDVKKVLQEIPKLKNVVVIESGGEIKTTYHNRKNRLKRY